eukprot:gene6978-7721_t
MLAKRVIEFWFTDSLKLISSSPPTPIPSTAFRLWFGSDRETDRLIEDNFAHDLESLVSDSQKREEMQASPEGAVALLVLFDQFTRNIFRNKPEAFAYDQIALDTANWIRSRGWDREMNPIYRGFVYLPYEHSEKMSDQLISVQLSKDLRQEVASVPEVEKVYGQFAQQCLHYATLHHDIIAKFGRYPHRNFILGRTSTPEETEYLESGAETFGVTKTK